MCGGGDPGARCGSDHGEGGVDVFQYEASAEPEGFDALTSKPFIPMGIADGSVGRTVALPIHLDAEARPRAVEVEDVGAQRVLLAEVEALLSPGLEALPEQGLGQGQGSAQAPGQGVGFGG